MKYIASILIFFVSLTSYGRILSDEGFSTKAKYTDTASIDTICLSIPNVVSPNAEGIRNDFFFITSQCPVLYYQIQIYNRWGELVFETKDINNDWDGTTGNNHLECPQDVYVYKILYQSTINQPKKEYTGPVTLIR